MSRSLVYATGSKDAELQLPVYVIDSTVLLSTDQLPDPETDIPNLMKCLPSTGFVILFFASRAPRTPQINWLRRTHMLLPRSLKKNIHRIYVLHAKWYTRALNRALAPIVSPKFSSKICFVKNLTELSQYLDITTIDVNPLVYLDDIDHTQSGDGSIRIPKKSMSIFGTPLSEVPTNYWRAALTFLRQSQLDESTFNAISRLSENDVDLLQILCHAVSREQKLRLYDYGPTAVLGVLKEYMLSLPDPIISLNLLSLPLRDDKDYAESVLSELPLTHLIHLNDIVKFCRSISSQVDILMMARSIGPAVMGIRNPRKESLAISVRFFKTLLESWHVLDLRENHSSLKEIPVYARQPVANNREDDDYIRATSMYMNTLGKRVLSREIPEKLKQSNITRNRIPNRKAYGKVAEIMKIYENNHVR